MGNKDTILKSLKEQLIEAAQRLEFKFPTYENIKRLDVMLTNAGIPHTFKKHTHGSGYQLCYPSEFDVVLSAIDNEGSYGHGENLIEIMGLLEPEEAAYDDVVGNLTAEQVFDRILKHYNSDYINPADILDLE